MSLSSVAVSYKTPAVLRREYVIQLEAHYDGGVYRLFVHSEIAAWSPRVYRAMQIDMGNLHDLIDLDLHALSIPGDLKHQKFLRAGGFLPAGDEWVASDGTPRLLFVRPKEN